MSIGTVTLLASGADVATTSNNIVTASFTTTPGNLYILALAESGACNGVTAGHTGTNWQWHKTQTATAPNVIELFGGLCTTGFTGTATLNWAAAQTATYAIYEITNPAAATPVIQKVSSAALTTTLAATTGNQSATILVARNNNAMTIEAGYTAVASLGTTHKLLTGYRSTFDTTPSFTGTSGSPAIIGAEISTLTTAAAAVARMMMLMGVGS